MCLQDLHFINLQDLIICQDLMVIGKNGILVYPNPVLENAVMFFPRYVAIYLFKETNMTRIRKTGVRVA